MEKILRIYTFLMMLGSTLNAATYYVRPNGHNAQDGLSPATAWQTTARVNAQSLRPGDSVLFEGGQTFRGELKLAAEDTGSPDRPITIGSYGAGRATLHGGYGTAVSIYNTAGIRLTGLNLTGNGLSANTGHGINCYTDRRGDAKLRFLEFTELDITGFGGTGLLLGSNKGNTGFADVLIERVQVHEVRENGIHIYGYFHSSHRGWAHRNVTLRYCQVHDVPGFAAETHKGSGIILGQVDGGLVEYCTAHDNGSGNTHCGGPIGIWAWDSNNVIIQFCESYRNRAGTGCDGAGFDLDGGVTNSVLQYNYSHENDGAGFLLGQFDYARPWRNNTVRYNVSENDGRTNGGGIMLFKGPGTRMNGARIYHNTVYVSPSSRNAEPGAFTIKEWETGIGEVGVYNNIFFSTRQAPVVSVPPGYQAFFAGNLYWNPDTVQIRYQGRTFTDLAAWRAATGNEQVQGKATGLATDPGLLLAGLGGTVAPAPVEQLAAYQLTVNSPAMDAGLDLRTVFGIDAGPICLWNTPATVGPARDIGAHESPWSAMRWLFSRP